MKKSLLTKIKELSNKEDGAAELINALLVIPILIILVFSIFNVGSYFISMSQVTEITQNAARQVAIYGGENSNIAKVKNGETISTSLKNDLYESGKCTVGTCKEPPVVNCTKFNGVQPGDLVSCEVTYTYKSMLSGLDFGISGILEQPRTIKQTSVSETWGY